MTAHSFVTWLGDIVHVRLDDDGNEHITVECEQRVRAELELASEPSGLAALTRYRAMSRNRSK
jgi:hypothetical protein